jgi:hypothetical protein
MKRAFRSCSATFTRDRRGESERVQELLADVHAGQEGGERDLNSPTGERIELADWRESAISANVFFKTPIWFNS